MVLTGPLGANRFYQNIHLGQEIGKLGQGIRLSGGWRQGTDHRVTSAVSRSIQGGYGTVLFDGTRCVGASKTK